MGRQQRAVPVGETSSWTNFLSQTLRPCGIAWPLAVAGEGGNGRVFATSELISVY